MDADDKPFGSDQLVTDYLSHICDGVFTDEATTLISPVQLSSFLKLIGLDEAEFQRAGPISMGEVSKLDLTRTRSDWELYKSIPLTGSVWWPCWQFLTFALDFETFVFPLCGVDRRQGSANAFVRLYLVNKQAKLLQVKPILESTWSESSGFPYSELALLNGRAIWILKTVQANEFDIKHVQSRVYAFNDFLPVELLNFDSFYRNWESDQCKKGDIKSCHADSWFLGRPWSNGQSLDMLLVGRRQLYNERYGEHSVDISTRMVFDETTWRFKVLKPLPVIDNIAW
jgi:hypothetical protein